jgi:glycosyltransferase involved in cell wall biosynthesis
MRSKNWDIPLNNKVLLNCKPFESPYLAKKTILDTDIDEGIELVFFGRLETRKGLDIFLRAISNFKNSQNNNISKITFLGKSINLGKTTSIQHIKTKTKNINIPIQIITDYDRTRADDYIKKQNILVVMPSLVENSPYTVYECLVGGVNFIASSIGGIPELIPQENHSEILFEPNPIDLYSKIIYRLAKLKVATRLVSTALEIEEKWIAEFNDGTKAKTIELNEHKSPFVSICLVHHDRPHLLQQAISSLTTQTYNNFEVILVDDGSTEIESIRYLELLEKDFSSRGWKIIRSSNNYLGAARNLATRHAKGEYFIFMDDDNVAKPDEIESFVKAAINSNSDILTTPSDLIFGDEFPAPFRKMTDCWLPLGADLNVASFSNCFGDANAMIRAETFKKIGGFTEDYGLGHEDWEFFAKATLSGFKLMVIPEPLFWYRVAKTGMLLSGNTDRNNYRSYRPFTESNSTARYAMGLIPGYIKKISQLEKEIALLRNASIYTLDNKLDGLISQEQDGWANDRFNVLNDKLHVINVMTEDIRNLIIRGSLLKRVARKIKRLII